MSKYSPYSNSTVINYDNGEQTIESNLDLPLVDLGSKVHVVREGETLASISYQYFGDSGFWGRIAQYNKILNPFTEVVPNKQILIPNG